MDDKRQKTLVSEWVTEWGTQWGTEWDTEWDTEWVTKWVTEWVTEWLSKWLSVKHVHSGALLLKKIPFKFLKFNWQGKVYIVER